MSRTDQIKMQFQRTMLFAEVAFAMIFVLLAFFAEPWPWFVALAFASLGMAAYRVHKIKRILFPPMPAQIFVCARSWAEALDFGASRGFTRHRIVYIYTPDQLRGMRGSQQKIYFIGSWQFLPKAMDIFRMVIAQCLDYETVEHWRQAGMPRKDFAS